MKRVLTISCALLTVGAMAAGAAALDFNAFISMGRVSDAHLSPDGEHVVFVITRMSMEDNKGDSDLYLANIDGSGTRRLTSNPGRDNQPRFSPNGEWIAFTSSRSGKSQVWLLPTRGGEATQLTNLSTGASSPMWTPDGKRVVFRSNVYPDCDSDECNEKKLAAEEKSKRKARVIDELLYVHWDHWRDARRGHVFVQDVDGGEARDLTPVQWEVPTITLGSGHDVAISPDGREICVVVNTDGDPAVSINNDLFVLPLDGGEMKRITTNPANDNHPVYSPDGKYIAYRAMSRPGFEADRYRVMLYDRKSGEVKEGDTALAQHFDRSVSELTWSPDSHRIYVTCQDEGYRSIYEIDARGGKVRQLTKDRYNRDVRVSANGKRLVFLSQSATMPFEVFTSDKNGKNVRQVSHVNDAALAKLELNSLESFTFAGAGGTEVHGWLLKPPGFDASKKWPMLFMVHGGPQGMLADGWHWRWNYQMFAAPGNVVVAINPRGSTGYGQKFTDEISRDWGGKVYEDLMNGLDYVLANNNYIDEKRLAAAGASYGGYMMNWFESHTDRFQCLVNHDGVYNLESMYGSTEELWFPEWEFGGPPWEGSVDYEKWSPHKFAANFKTPMLVVHGALDYRVPFTQGQEVFTALQRQGVPSKMLFFPDEGHWVLKPQNAELWWATVLGWIDEYVGGDSQSGAMR